MAQKVSAYLKNVAKSFGYALGDNLASYNPVIVSLGKETKEVTNDLYQNIKSFSFDKQSIDEKSLKGQVKDSIDDVWKNVKEDLRSGTWYNKTRKNAADSALADSMMKSMGIDFNFDFDDEDWGDFDDESSLASAVVSSENKSAREVINAVDEVGYKIAGSVSNATIESASYIVASSNRSSKALYNLNSRGFSQISSAILAVNGTIASFAKIGEPLTVHMQNSATFFTNTTSKLNEIHQSLEKIVKNTTPAPLASQKRTSSISGTFSDIVSSDGLLSIDAYKNMIKETFSENKDMIDMGLNAIKGLKSSGSNGSYGKNVSLMQFATTMFTGVLIPKALKESMKSFNESLKYAISGGIVKARNKDFGGSTGGMILELLKDYILPKDGFKSKINVANYEKGAVSWDGYSRKALIEVIPEYLSGIYRSLSGEDKVYNYQTGRFVTRRSVKADELKEQRRYAKEAGGDFREDALSKIEKSGLSDKEREKLTKEVEDYFLNAFTKAGNFYDINKSNFNASKYGLSDDSLALLRELILENRNDPKKRNNHTKFVSQNQRQRDEYGNRMRQEEANGTSSQVYLYNGFYTESDGRRNGPNFGLDEYNHSTSFYLQGIYQYTGFLADNIGFIGGKSKKIKRRKNLRRGGDIQSIDERLDSANSAGERTKEEANTSNDIPNDIPLDEDEARNKEREDRNEELGKRAKSFKDKLKGLFSRGENGRSGLSNLYNRPFNAAAKLLDRLSLSLDKLIWGDDNNPEKGIMGFIFKKANEFTDWLENKFKIKERFSKLKDKLFGEDGILSDLKEETGKKLKGAGKWLGDSVKQFFDKGGWRRREDVPTAAYGRKVTKSGIVAVSEGELIIPSELNPFYHGYTNKGAQIRNEQRIVDNFYGSFAEGGTVGGREKRKQRGAKSQGPTIDETRQRLYGKYEKIKEGEGHKLVREGFETLGGGISKLFHNMFGSGDEKQTENDNKIIKSVMQKLLQEAGDNKGAMGAGALIGAGVSLATGAVVGPVFGAAIGSAVGLAVNSKTVQHILFGADPETGEVNGGLLPKNISQFMMKNVPSMAKGGALGGIAGLFMGSPILGAVVGSAIGYVSSSEKAKEFIFGSEQKEGIIPKEFQNKIKKAAPNMAAGAIAGLALGPFGLVGNLIAGAGLGYVTTSEKFHDYMFGNGKDDKGLAGLFKEKIFDNLDEIFHNMGNAIAGWGKNIIRSTSDRLKDFFTKRARAFENGERQGLLGKLIGGATSFTGKAVKGATDFVGNRLGGINSRLKSRNLSRGYNVYDREKKRNLTAAERAQMRGEGARGTFANFDNLISNGSLEELEQLRDQLRDADDPNRMFKRSQNKAMSALYEGMKDSDPKLANKIAKYVQKGDVRSLERIKSTLTPEEMQKYGKTIEEALNSMAEAKDSRNKGKAILNSLSDKGMKFNKGDLRTAIDRLNDEINSDRFSPEEQAKKKEEDWRDRVVKIFKSMDINIARLVHGGGETAEDGNQKEGNPDQQTNSENTEPSSIRDTLNSINNDVEKTQNKFTYSYDLSGAVHKYTTNSQGEPEEVKNDAATDESRQKMDKFFASINHIPVIGAGLAGISGMFKGLGEKLFGSEEKPGLLSKMLDFLGGEDGPLNWIFNLVSGSPIGKIVKSGLSKITLGRVLTNVVAPALLMGGFNGLFDNFFNKATDGAYGKGGDSTVYENKETGETVTKNADGTYTDKDGNIVDSRNIRAREGDVSSFSEKLKYNTARGVLTGTKSVASTVLGRTALGRQATGLAGNAIKAIGGDTAALTSIGDTILDGCIKFTGALRKIPALKGIADKLDDMGMALAEKATSALASSGAKKALDTAKNLVFWAKIAFIAVDFTTGYEDARTTLGITDEPTVGQKIISGLLRAVKNFIPIIGTLLPDSLIIDVFCKYVAPALGIEPKELMAQREKALQDVANYNAATGSNIQSVGEFNKTVLKDYTWTERIGNAATNTWNDTKDRFNNMKSGIQEKGLFGYMGDSVKGMASDFMTSYKESGGGIAGVFSGMGKTFENLLPGIFGEIAKKNSDIKSLAFKGNLKELWGVSLDDFSGGGQTIEGTDLTTAVPGIFSKAIGQLPLIINKISMTPVALASGIFNKAKDGVSKIFDSLINKIKAVQDFQQREREYGNQLLNDPDSHLSDFFKFDNEDPENPLNGFTKGIAVVNRLTAIPVAIVRKIGRNIKEKFDELTDPIKNSFTTLAKNQVTINNLAKAGDISGLNDLEFEDNPENLVGGFTKGMFQVNRIMGYIPAGVHWIGNKIKDAFDALTKDTATNRESMSKGIDNMKKYAQEGDLKSVWNEKFEPGKADPIQFVWKVGFGINKLFQSAIAIFNKIMGPVKETLEAAGEFIGDVKDKVTGWVGDRVDDVKDTAKGAWDWATDKAEGAYQSVKSWLSGGGSGTQGQFVSQLDPKYRAMKFGDSTVGEKGCAPAVASMIASKYGKKLSMEDAISATNGFRNEEGTSVDYFKKVLNSQGIATNYLTGNNVPGQIMQNLANGQQVILLGKDANNKSKKNSPFGPNGHYVVATGIDKNGNIIINDPESNQPRVYNKSILNSAKLGVGTNGYGSGTTNADEVAKKAWSYYTSNGYSPAATAGILANLKAESALNPASIQGNGKGPAAGIAQWENYNTKSSRWKAMSDYAASKGYQWTELTPQLEFIHKEVAGLGSYFKNNKNIEGYTVPATTVEEFKKSSDPQMAAMQFEKAFERAGKPRMSTRLGYASEFYKKFCNSEYTGNYTPDSPDPNASVGVMSSGLTDSGSTESSSGGIMGIISAIGTAFSNALGKVFSVGSDSTAGNTAGSYGPVDYSGDSSNVNLGEVPQGKGNAAQKKIVQYANSILGKDQYSQDANLRTRVGRGYSDCSSFAQWAYKQALGIDPGGYTGAQIQSPLLTTVDSGSTPNKDRLEAGDLLFFRSKSNNGRYKNVGHVEIYDGNGNTIGHGSGQGPKKVNLDQYVASRARYGGPYIEARRYKDIANAAGGSSGLLLNARPGTKVYGSSNSQMSIPSGKTAKRFSGGASMVSETKDMLNDIKSDIVNRGKSGSISADLVEKLLQSIIGVLETISKNTSSVDKIYQALVAYTNGKSVSDSAKVAAVASKGSSDDGEVDANIRNLTGTLAAIAKG